MPANHTELEKRLWGAADELRANSKLKSSEYSVPVLGLIFLRYADHKFSKAKATLDRQGTGRRTVGKADYQAQGVLYLPEAARFSALLNLPEGAEIGRAVNEAMKAIEAENEDLKEVLPKTYNQLDKELLVSLLKNFAAIPMDIEGDAFGKIYEYFLGKFAVSEGQKGRRVLHTDQRSQYEIFAANMRCALPNAAFIGFTGTPLMAGEELIREVLGDCVSVDNFKESVDDVNTVPLYYQNRIPEFQLTNDNLTEEIADIFDRAELDDDQEWKLEREFAREYHLITWEDRLERIGEDIVAHYMGRGVLAKAMVISVDKASAVRTCDKVRGHWAAAVARLRKELAEADPTERPEPAVN